MVDRSERDIEPVGFQDHPSPADRHLPYPALTETSAHRDAFRIPPVFELEKLSDDQRELLREFLDRALHDACRLRIAVGEQRVEIPFAEFLGRLVAEWIVAVFAHDLAPIIQDGAKCFLAGAVAQESFVVPALDVVAVNVHCREAARSVRRQYGRAACLRHSMSLTKNP
jgi:hypothetical protein